MTADNRWIEAANRFGRVESQIAQVDIKLDQVLKAIEDVGRTLKAHIDADETWMKDHDSKAHSKDIAEAESRGFRKGLRWLGRGAWAVAVVVISVATVFVSRLIFG